ncbi:galactokinase [Agromyces archimandritae]|uniref:Galactokinase n=1 Tax=Agromyces archimandritae TaxID=2781962 RepID=A0A975IMW2_9MICO|nr:galactokinase [Agromyces archimandritae]QTX03953.1 galactokinase [Agromyces archimandritae]
MTLTDRTVAAFAERHGRQAAGVWSAPGRVNLIGEHTDYNEGFVLPFGIDRRTAVALAPREDRLVRVTTGFADGAAEFSLDTIDPDAGAGWHTYPLGLVWALGELGAPPAGRRGVDVHIESDVPAGAGLSSSAALEAALALALDEHWALGLNRADLARAGQLAENRVVGAPTGIMDQSASLLAEADAAVFLDCRSLEAATVPLGFSADGLSLLVIDTRVTHEHATGGYAARRASCEAGARSLGVASLRELGPDDLARAAEVLDDETFRRVRHIVTENGRVLDTVRALRSDGPTAIGPYLDASHASLRDDFEISTPELDLAVGTAQATGAIGARMTGGGFGGSAIALVVDPLVPVLERAVVRAFAEEGYAEPAVFTVRPSAGARRER